MAIPHDLRRLCDLVGWRPTARDIDWPEIELLYDTVLPADFKAYSELFPSGLFFNFVTVHTPNRSHVALDVFEVIGAALDPDRKAYEEDGEHVDPAVLLPWGWIGTDDLFSWWMDKPNPDEWNVVATSYELTEPFVFDCGMLELLVGMANGSIHISGLGHLADQPRRFDPIQWRVSYPIEPISIRPAPPIQGPIPRRTPEWLRDSDT